MRIATKGIALLLIVIISGCNQISGVSDIHFGKGDTASSPDNSDAGDAADEKK